MGVEKIWRKMVLWGPLQFKPAAGQIVGGTTSLSLRNNANSADNLLISDAGAATVRAGLTVTAGGATVTAGGLTVTAGGETVTAGDVQITAGGLRQGGAAGGAGTVHRIVKAITVTDNTATDLCTVTVTNQINGAALIVNALGVLGDGDSSNAKSYYGAISRIAGAATGVTLGTAFGTATNNGATANATVTITATGNTGANSATQTFKLQAKVARSAGSADNHLVVAEIIIINSAASGVTVA